MCERQCSPILIYFLLLLKLSFTYTNKNQPCKHIRWRLVITTECLLCWILITLNTHFIPICILTSMRNLPSKIENEDGLHGGRGWKSELDCWHKCLHCWRGDCNPAYWCWQSINSSLSASSVKTTKIKPKGHFYKKSSDHKRIFIHNTVF